MIEVTLIGTAATMPLPGRALSAAMLSCAGRSILLDCGEGTQSAVSAGVSCMKTDLIALTHYHGDHIFGLPGLMQSMSCLGRTQPLFITGPEGLETAMAPILALAGEQTYPVTLLETNGVIRLHALCGAWPEGASLTAFATRHRSVSQGYCFALERPARFQPERARQLGIPVKLWKALQAAPPDAPVILDGEPMRMQDGTPVRAGEVQGAQRRGIRVVYSGDTAPCPALESAARGADLLIMEATYGSDSDAPLAQAYGHSTFRQAGELAAAASVRRLWLTHMSQRLKEPDMFLPAAQTSFPCVQRGFDGMRLTLEFPQEG